MKRRISQSAKQALTKTNIYLSIFSAIVTIIGIIGYEKIMGNLLSRILIVIAIFTTSYFIALCVCFLRKNVSIQLGNGRVVDIEYGDLFSKQGVIVVPFNRFFDTVVNEEIVNEKSVAGQFVKNCFAGNLDELDRQLSFSLNKVLPDYCKEKLGKTSAYPIGTIIKVQKGENLYYCVAQTDIDQNSKSICDIEMLHKATVELLKFINREANGRKVYLPVLGAGFSRLNKEKQVILEYLISIFKTANLPIQSELHIVIRETERGTIDLVKYL